MEELQRTIETRLKGQEPAIEVLLAERVSAGKVRLVIDHPAGVDLELCERVTNHLRPLLTEFGLEVSSPGPERPLRKPEHFRRFVGRRLRIRTTETIDGRRSFAGELVAASEREVTVAVEGGLISFPYAVIGRSNLVEG